VVASPDARNLKLACIPAHIKPVVHKGIGGVELGESQSKSASKEEGGRRRSTAMAPHRASCSCFGPPFPASKLEPQNTHPPPPPPLVWDITKNAHGLAGNGHGPRQRPAPDLLRRSPPGPWLETQSWAAQQGGTGPLAASPRPRSPGCGGAAGMPLRERFAHGEGNGHA
jgi:hypothetical protein